MATKYDFTQSEIAWFQKRIGQLQSQFLEESGNDEYAETAARQQAWAEFSSLKDGSADPSQIQAFGRDLELYRTQRMHNTLAIALGIRGDTPYSPVDSTSPGSLPDSPLDSASGDISRGWQSPGEQFSWLIGKGQDPIGGVYPRSAGMPYSLGLEPFTGLSAPNTYQFNNPVATATANFFWGLWKGGTLGAGPAIQKLIERHTGANVYPNWADKPDTMLGRVAQSTGDIASWLVPFLGPISGSAKAFKAGAGLGTKVIGAGIKRAGKETAESLISKAGPRIAGRLKAEVGEAAAGLSDELVGELGELAAKSAVRSRVTFMSHNVADVWSAFGKGKSGDLALKIEKNLQTIGHIGIESIAKEKGLSEPVVSYLKKEMLGLVKEKSFGHLNDFAKGKISYVALSMAEHGFISGTSMALQSSALVASEMIGDEVPIKYAPGAIGGTIAGSYATGMMFGVFGAIPNAKQVGSKSAARLLGQSLGLSDKASYTLAAKVSETGIKGRLKSMFVRGVNLTQEYKTKGIGAIQRRGDATRTAMKVWEPENLNNYPAIRDGLWKTEEDVVNKLIPSLNSYMAAKQWQNAINAMGEIGDRAVAAFPRMAIAALAMNAKAIIDYRDQVERHPEDIISGIAMAMYFTRNHSMPLQNVNMGDNFGIPKAYMNQKIEENQMMMHLAGSMYPELFSNPRIASLILQYRREGEIPFDTSQNDAIVELGNVIKKGVAEAQMPADVKEKVKRPIDPSKAKPVKSGSNIFRSQGDMELFNARKELNELDSLDREVRDPGFGWGTEKEEAYLTLEKKYPAEAADYLKRIDRSYELEAKILELEDKGFTGRELVVEVEKGKGPEFEEVEELVTGETILKRTMDSGYRGLVRQAILNYNNTRGYKAINDGPLFDDARLSDTELYSVGKALEKHFGDDFLDPTKISELNAKAAENDTRKTHRIFMDTVHEISQKLNDGDFPMAIQLDRPDLQKDADLIEWTNAYNGWIQLGYATGDLRANNEGWNGKTTELHAQEERAAGRYAASVGTPKPPIKVYTPDQFATLRSKFTDSIESAKDAFGEIVGKEWRNLVTSPRSIEYHVNRALHGHGERFYKFFNEPGSKLFLTKGKRIGTTENPEILVSIDRDQLLNYVYTSGLAPNQAIMNLTETLKEMGAKAPNIGGVAGAEAHYETPEGRWEVLKSFLDVLPFYAEFVGREGGKDIKMEFFSQEVTALKSLVDLIIDSGLGFGKEHGIRLKNEAIGKRYARANGQQLAVLGAAEELKLWRWDTAELGLPDVVEFVNEKGEAIKEYDNLEHVYTKVKPFAESRWASKVVDVVNDLIKLKIVKKVTINPDGIKAGDSYALAPGKYLVGEEAMDYLASALRVKEGFQSPETVIAQLKRQMRLAAKGDPSKIEIADIMNKEIVDLVFQHTGASYGKVIHFFELHGMIKAVDAEGYYDMANVENIFSAKMQNAIRSFSEAHSAFTAKGLIDRGQAEESMLLNQLKASARQGDTEKGFRGVEIAQFMDRTKLTPEQNEVILNKIRNGEILNGYDLRDHIVETLEPGSDPLKYADTLNWRAWQAAYKQMSRTRLIKEITFDGNLQFVLDERGVPELAGAPGVTVKQIPIGAGQMVDDFLESGLEVSYINEKVYTGRMTKKDTKYKQVLGYEESVVLDENQIETYNQLQDLLYKSNTQPELAKKGLYLHREDGVKGAYLADVGVVVPIGIGDNGRYLAFKLPGFSRQVDSSYVKFYNAAKRMEARFDMLFDARNAEANSGAVDWHGEQNELDIIRASVKKFLEKLPDPLSVNLSEGSPFAGFGVPSSHLSRVLHAMTLMNRFGPSIFGDYQNALRKHISKDFEGKDPLEIFYGEIFKRAKNYVGTSLSAETLDQNSWNTYRDEINQDASLRGPELGDKMRFVVVDDVDIEAMLPGWKEKFGSSGVKYDDGMIPMSQKVAAAICRGVGAKDDSPLIKGFFASTEANSLGETDLGSALTKASYQVLEFYQPLLEKLGVDFIVPRSALKFASEGFKARMLGLQELGSLPEITRTIPANVIEMPVKDFNLIGLEDNTTFKEAAVSTSMEYSLQGEALGYLYRKFGGSDEISEDGGMKMFDDFMGLLAQARAGNTSKIIELNKIMQYFYTISEQAEGYVVEPDFPSAHKAFIFASPLNNPMDPAWRDRTIGFIRKRVLTNNTLKAHTSHGRQGVLQAPFLSDGLNKDFHLSGPDESFGEDPISEGMVRLYRGTVERPSKKQKLPAWTTESEDYKAKLKYASRWYTSERSEAEWYVRGNQTKEQPGRLYYVDVPKEIADRWHLGTSTEKEVLDAKSQSKNPDKEWLLPKEYADRRQEVREKPNGIGQMLGSAFDQSLRLHDNTQLAYWDQTKGEWKHEKISKKSIAEMFVSMSSDKDFKLSGQFAGEVKGDLEEYVYREITGPGQGRVTYRTNPGTEGRFFEVMDYVIAGSHLTKNGYHFANKSYEYGITNLRGKNKFGLLSMAQRYPSMLGNDTIIAVKMGFLPEMHGNAVMLNRYDAIKRSKADWDWDKLSYFNDMDPALINELIRRSGDPTDVEPAHNTVPMNFQITSLEDWTKYRHNRHLADRGIGQAQNENQAYGAVVAGQRYVKLIDSDTDQPYFLGPRYRSYDDMVKNRANTTLQREITTFTDAAGKLIDAEHQTDDWKANAYRKLFARYKPDAQDPSKPDFNTFMEILPHQSDVLDLIDSMMNPYRRLSKVVSSQDSPNADGSKGTKIDDLLDYSKKYTTMMLGPGMNPNLPSQNQLVAQMMNDLSWKGKQKALTHIWKALGIDPATVNKLLTGKGFDKDKGESLWSVLESVKKTAEVGPNLYYQGNAGYESVRERLARRIATSADRYHEDKNRGLNRAENDNLGLMTDALFIGAGLPDKWSLNRLSGFFFRYYKNKAVAHVSEIMEEQQRIKTMLDNKDYKKGEEKKLRGQLAGMQLFIKEKQRYLTAEEKKDQKQHFAVNGFGGKGVQNGTRTVSDRDMLDDFMDRWTAWTITNKDAVQNPELFKRIQEDAFELRSIRGKMYHDAFTSGVGDAVFSRRAGVKGSIWTQLTSETLNQAEQALIDEYLLKWSGNKKLASLLLFCDAPDKVTGYWEVNAPSDAQTRLRTDKNFIPTYRKPMMKALNSLESADFAEWALVKSIIRNSIVDGDTDTAMSMIRSQLDGYATQIRRTPGEFNPGLNAPLFVGLEMVTSKRHSFGADNHIVDAPTGTRIPMEAWDGPMAIKLGPDVFTMSYREFLTMITKSPIAQSFTTPTDMQVWSVQQAEAVMDGGGVLDVTKADSDNPLKKIASFVLSERKRTLPEFYWEDVRMMSRWLKTTTGQATAPFGRQVDANLARQAQNNRMLGSGGLAARKGSTDLWGTDPVELQKSQNEIKQSLGRLWAEIARNNEYGDHRGSPLDFQDWAVKVLGKDIQIDRITVEDIGELKMAWRRELDQLRMAKGRGWTGAMWGFKRNFFATSAILDSHFLTQPVGQAHERGMLDKQRKEAIHSKHAMRITGGFQKLITKIGISKDFMQYSQEVSRRELDLQSINRSLEVRERAMGKIAALDSETYKKFQKAKIKIQRELREMKKDPRGMTAENRIHDIVASAMDLGNCIESVDSNGKITWISGREAVRDEIIGGENTTGTYQNYRDDMISQAREIHTLFRDIRPDMVDGYVDWKKLMLIKLKNANVDENTANSIIESLSLGYQKGYIPEYNYDHFNTLATIADRGFTEPNAIIEALQGAQVKPRGTGEMMHRTGGLDWSKNITLTMNRYIQDVYTFKYKNSMELALYESINGLTKLQSKQSAAFHNQSKALVSYLEKWREDNIDVSPKEDFYSVAAQYVRGIQLISKLGWQISTPIRNLSQLAAQTYMCGWSNVKAAKEAYENDKEFREFVGDLGTEGSLGDFEIRGGKSDIHALMYGRTGGAERRVRENFKKIVSSSLYPLQHMPLVGEQAVRKTAKLTAYHQVYQKYFLNESYREMFERRDFSESFIRAYPELARFTEMDTMGNKIGEKEWASLGGMQFRGWCQRMAENASADLSADVHFEYSMGSRPEAFRTPLGSVLFQLKYFTVKNAEMWTHIVKDGVARGQVSGSWGEAMKSKEFAAIFGLGAMGIFLQSSAYIAPLGLGWMFRPDFMDVLQQNINGLRAATSGDQEKIDRAFYGKGALQYAFGPAVGDATMMLNLAFAQHIGNPSNAAKLLAGARDFRNMDNGDMFFKMARAFGPAVIADAIRYDLPELVRNKFRTWPQAIAGVAGFNYRKDEGVKAKQLANWLEGKYNDQFGGTTQGVRRNARPNPGFISG